MESTYDFVIIGAGVIGVSIGTELLKRNPKQRVLIIDKEKNYGMHASGRNSGVIHAGFYYSPDSLKAKLTRDGNFLIKEFADKRKIKYRVPGKVVVATNEDQKKLIIDLHDRGIENNVKVKIISQQDLLRI
jgi:L-2-hydroxyglutarate oxidase LhgO